jgi:hypothetical protein
VSDSAAYATVKLYIKTDLLLIFIRYYYTIADSIDRAVKGVGLRPLAGTVGFESHGWHGCLSVVSVVRC